MSDIASVTVRSDVCVSHSDVMRHSNLILQCFSRDLLSGSITDRLLSLLSVPINYNPLHAIIHVTLVSINYNPLDVAAISCIHETFCSFKPALFVVYHATLSSLQAARSLRFINTLTVARFDSTLNDSPQAYAENFVADGFPAFRLVKAGSNEV